MFLVKMFSDKNGNPSSKRMTGFVALALIVLFAIRSAWGVQVDYEIWYSLIALAGFQSSLTLLEKREVKRDGTK